MKKSLIDKINIYITVDLQPINSYFNAHDPSPLYKNNSYLKDILFLAKLSTAEVIISESKKTNEPEQAVKYDETVELSKSVTFESLLSN